MDDVTIVWWAFLAGGAVGGLARLALDGRFELPYAYRDPVTRRRVFVPGFVGDLLLAPVAVFLVLGSPLVAGGATSAYNAQGFWGAFTMSILPAMLGAQIIRDEVKRHLKVVEDELLQHAKEVTE